MIVYSTKYQAAVCDVLDSGLQFKRVQNKCFTYFKHCLFCLLFVTIVLYNRMSTAGAEQLHINEMAILPRSISNMWQNRIKTAYPSAAEMPWPIHFVVQM